MRSILWTSLRALPIRALRDLAPPVAAERAAPLSLGCHCGPTHETTMKASRFGFTVAQKDTDVLELDVYDMVGDTWEEDSVTAKRVRSQLKESKASTIRVRINSIGGDTLDALSIYNQLSEHPADVEVNIDGVAASAATIIAMAASPGKLRMAEASELMIHEPRFPLMLNVDAAKARKAADRLDKEAGILAGVYAKRSERPEDEVRDLMRAETWFTAAEALDAGLIDAISDGASTASISPTVAAAALQRFRNVPERIVARAQQASGRTEAMASPPVINVPSGTDPAAVERALIEALAAPVAGVIVPPAETIPAAALAAPVRTAAEAATPQEHCMDPKVIASALGLPEDATESQIRTAASAAFTGIGALLGALGVTTVDAARGAIEAGRAAITELPKAQARVKELETAAENAERASIIAKLESEKRLTPAQRDGFAKTASLEALRSFAETAPVIVAASPHHEAPPAPAASAATAATTAPITVDGKRAYEHLSGPERVALQQSDLTTFNAVRASWISRGRPADPAAG